MNRTHVLIASMAAIILILAVALAYLVGRRSTEPAAPLENAAANATAIETATGSPGGPPPATTPDPNSDAELSRWIVGSWASSSCDTDNGEEFAREGRYYGYESEGRWRIENRNLIVTVTRAQQDPNAGLGEGEITPIANPRPVSTPITRNGPNRMGLLIDGRPSSMIRCDHPAASRSPSNG